jgi:hypothetical protein
VDVARINIDIQQGKEQIYSRSCARVGDDFQVTIPDVEEYTTEFPIENRDSDIVVGSETHCPLWGTVSARREWCNGGPKMKQLFSDFKKALRRFV